MGSGKLPSGETKSQFRERMRREGRWREFCDWREARKSEGLSASDIWFMCSDEFPVLCSDEIPPEHLSADVNISDPPSKSSKFSVDKSFTCLTSKDVKDKPGVSALEVVQWVFDNVDVMDLTPSDAPSGGAWSLLHRLRMHPGLLQEFYKSIWSKTLPSRSELTMKERFNDDGRHQLKLVQELLDYNASKEPAE